MELSFLYVTRTTLRPITSSGRVVRTQIRHRCLQQAHHGTQDQISFFREKAEAVAAKLGKPERSSITREEHRAFDNLRRLAGQTRQPSQQQDSSQVAGLLDTNPQALLALFTPPTTSSTSTGNEDEISRICHQYMVSLAGQFKEDLKAQQADQAIWHTLRTRVFPLLALLKDQKKITPTELRDAEKALPISKTLFKQLLQQPQQNATKTHDPAATESDSQNHPSSAESQPSTSSPSATSNPTTTPNPTISPLPILSRLYPTSLLLSLRLLTLHHPLSSLTPSILSHTRSLGSTSYILGTNPHFYNTFLFLRWNTHSSLREICELLSEMERGAVDFDRGTFRILRDMGDERERDLSALQQQRSGGGEELEVEEDSLGSRGGQWWLRAEQMQWWPKVEEWQRVIARKLEEQGVGEVIREGPLGDASSQEGGARVWL